MSRSNRPGDKIDLLRRIATYHENIENFYTGFQNTLHAFETDTAQRALNSFREYFINEVMEHFAFEEKIVFPALRFNKKDRQIANCVNELTKDHTAIFAAFEQFVASLDTQESRLDAIELQAVRKALAELCALVLVHTKKEELCLIPLVEQHETVRYLMGTRLLRYRLELGEMFATKV
jgi:iron-sulfur cluster repair protein YtfE (RIC family)